MIMVLGATLATAGALQIMLAARMWSGKYYEANRRLASVVPYGVAPWTMPLPIAGFGITFIGIRSCHPSAARADQCRHSSLDRRRHRRNRFLCLAAEMGWPAQPEARL